MTPRREQLAQFHRQLQKEYDDFVVRERLVERLAERDAQWEAWDAEEDEADGDVGQESSPEPGEDC